MNDTIASRYITNPQDETVKRPCRFSAVENLTKKEEPF